jgi:hypothetical protein
VLAVALGMSQLMLDLSDVRVKSALRGEVFQRLVRRCVL